ncbi:MAG: hypothetical protein ACREIR_08025 [Geminicoccaceae bacterium]
MLEAAARGDAFSSSDVLAYGASSQRCYVVAMLGRVLFALVCVVIAAGLVLPLYPSGVEAPRSVAADPVLLAADAATSGCEDCPIADAGSADQPDGPCARLLPAILVAVGDSSGLSVILVIRSQPSELPFERQARPPKLPAI